MQTQAVDGRQLIDRSDWMWLILLTALACATRIYGVWAWDYVADEWFTLLYSHERYTNLVNPAYYALVVASFSLFGESEWSLRLPATIIGIATLPVFYFAWKSIVGRNVAVIASLILLVSDWHIWYSQFGRFYSGVFLFGSLSYYFYYTAFQKNDLKYLSWALLANFIAVLFHVTTVLIAASIGVFSLFLLATTAMKDDGLSRRIAKVFLGLSVFASAIAIPVAWIVLQDWTSGKIGWGNSPFVFVLQSVQDVQVVLSVLAFFGIVSMLLNNREKGAFFTLGICVPVFCLLIISLVGAVRPDYFFYTLPLIYISAAYSCEQIRQALQDRFPIPHILAVTVLISMMPEFVSYYSERSSLHVRNVLAYVENNYEPGDRIVSFFPIHHYTKGTYSQEQTVGSPFANDAPWREMLEELESEGNRIWIILPLTRANLARDLESWLNKNARLVWRKKAVTYNYTVKGHQLFLFDGANQEFSSNL